MISIREFFELVILRLQDRMNDEQLKRCEKEIQIMLDIAEKDTSFTILGKHIDYFAEVLSELFNIEEVEAKILIEEEHIKYEDTLIKKMLKDIREGPFKDNLILELKIKTVNHMLKDIRDDPFTEY